MKTEVSEKPRESTAEATSRDSEEILLKLEPPIQVLLIEDSSFDAKLLEMQLKKMDDSHRYSLVHTKRISKGLRLLERDHFDLVILDLTLPDSRGTASVEAVHRQFPSLPIVVVTGTDDYGMGIEAIKKGAQDYLIKGLIEPPLLTKALTFALNRSKTLGELRKIAESEKYAAQHDHLTGIPNRKMFEFAMGQTLKQCRRSSQLFGILFIDLDGFKKINDTYGHDFGDIILKTTAKRILNCVRESDLVARFGGDEFAVILRDIRQHEDASLVAHKIISAIEVPIEAIGHSLHLSASVGISIFPMDTSDGDELLKFADTAMYTAKNNGQTKCQFFNPLVQAQVCEKMGIEICLREAWEKNEFIPHFQPQFDLRSGILVGMEILARWKYKGIGLISAGEFVPFAENSGLILKINEWIFREACAASKKWGELTGHPLRVSANLSAQQLRQENLISIITSILNETKIDPSLLCLEFQETPILQELPRYLPRLRELKKVGVTLALDHFGGGSTSINSLEESLVDEVKIDCGIIHGFCEDPTKSNLVAAMIRAAHCLGLRVSSEGIESKDQLEALKLLGCDMGQGYFLGRPTSAEVFEGIVRTGEFIEREQVYDK